MSTHLMKTLQVAIFFVWVFIATSFTTWASTTSSIYDALKSHGLPMGLLPKGVKNYSLDENGKFEVYLDQACNAEFESALHYDKNVSGLLSFGQIGNLSGIEAQDLFLWFPVKEIRVDFPSTGVIYFDVGVVFKQFSLSLFESPPDCVAASRPSDLKLTRPEKFGGFVKKLSGVVRYIFDQAKSAREIM